VAGPRVGGVVCVPKRIRFGTLGALLVIER